MKLSELKAKIEEAEKEHGDINVVVWDFGLGEIADDIHVEMSFDADGSKYLQIEGINRYNCDDFKK